jgi:hypothetical protein
MNALSDLRAAVSDWLWLRATEKHRSRMGYRDSPRYTRYWDRARRRAGNLSATDPVARENAEHFKRDGWTAFVTPETEKAANEILAVMKQEEAQGLEAWKPNGRYGLGDVWQKFPQVEALFQGVVGDFLRGAFGCHFKIFYGASYRSLRLRDHPTGSELWHADGGPGTCINLMFCLTPSTPRNGTMELISWPDSLALFRRERAVVRERVSATGNSEGEGPRSTRAEYYREEIEQNLSGRVHQPSSGPGLIYAFTNNLVHKGGFPEPGEERYVLLFHVYPAAEPPPFDRYRASGVPKTAPLPHDPAF